MNIVVLNGSPKGKLSVTMQYVAYLAKTRPEHQFDIIHISQRIRRIENNESEFQSIIDKISQADAVMWGFPLYVLMVHANYKRFIELIWERGVQGCFAGKYTTALSTSIHFFDHTAHNYIHAVCDDLQMKYVDYFSADMNDLRKESGRKKFSTYFELFVDAVENQMPTRRMYLPLQTSSFSYKPGPAQKSFSDTGKKVVILHDEDDADSNLGKMISRCADRFDGKAVVVNINRLNIQSCMGCMKCSGNFQCLYTGKDDYIEFYKNTVMTADVLIYAGRMVDRYLSARWKIFFDRIFFNTHTPALTGKQVAFLVSGPLSQTPNIMEILRAFFEFQGGDLVGAVSDEVDDSKQLDEAIDGLVQQTMAHADAGYIRLHTFLGEGGMRIFRDDIYGRLRTVFAADHRAYKKLGIYDSFPQRDIPTILLNIFVAPLVRIPPIRRVFDQKMPQAMVDGYKSVLENAVPLKGG